MKLYIKQYKCPLIISCDYKKSAALVTNMYLTDSTVLSKTRVQSQLLCQARPATTAAPVNLKANSVNFPRNLGADSSWHFSSWTYFLRLNTLTFFFGGQHLISMRNEVETLKPFQVVIVFVMYASFHPFDYLRIVLKFFLNS